MLARATLESLLRERKLDATLAVFPTSGENGDLRRDPDAQIPTGHPRADHCLDGGWPRGHLSTLTGPPSSGRTTLMVGALAAATEAGELAALVDASDQFDPVSAAARGVCLERMLWIRGTPAARELTQALRAFDLVLRAGGFALVVFDLSGVSARVLGSLPLTTWLRLGRSVEHSRTAALVLVDTPVARSAGGASLELTAAPARWRGQSAESRLFDGPSIAPRLRGFRRAAAK